jgi:hypothetical protein
MLELILAGFVIGFLCGYRFAARRWPDEHQRGVDDAISAHEDAVRERVGG